jgi:hypothetical protein
MLLRLAAYHVNALSTLGERVTGDGVFTSRRGPGEGVSVRYFHVIEESPRFVRR